MLSLAQLIPFAVWVRNNYDINPSYLSHSMLCLMGEDLCLSFSWVMLDDKKSLVPLPREKILFNSPPRTSLTLQTPNSYPGKEPLSIQCSSGTAFITNQRVSSIQILSSGIIRR